MCVYTHTHTYTYVCIYIIDTNTQKSIHGEYTIWRTITKTAYPQKHHPGQEINLYQHFRSPLPTIVLSLCLVTQLCPTPCDTMNCHLPGSFVQGNSPGKNAGVGCHALLWGIFWTQESNPVLPYCRWILYHLCHQGSPSHYFPIMILRSSLVITTILTSTS